MKKAILFIIIALATICNAQTTYYVDLPDSLGGTGDNANIGTINAPFADVQYALNNATSPGDTIEMLGGRYYPRNYIWVDTLNCGTEGNRITIRSYENDTVILDYKYYDQPPNMAGNSYAFALRLSGGSGWIH